MNYLGKALEATGLTIIGIGYLAKFPELMSPRLLLAGMAIFGAGWLVERYGARK